MISIILPVYNVEDYLYECLSSIQNQNNEDIQVIIIDDGSTDNSYSIAEQFTKNFPKKFEYHYKKNGGLSDARNYGIQFVKGDYIWFIDSDDYISLDAIKNINEFIDQYSPDLIVFDYIEFDSYSNKVYKLIDGESRELTKKEYLLTNPCAWNKVIKTSIYKNNLIEFPKNLWYEDRATTGGYINMCENIIYINNPLYYYRQRDNSIMNQKQYNPKMQDILKSIQIMHTQLDNTIYKDEIEYITISNLIYQNGIRLLPYKKYSELEKSILYVKEKYSCWNKNIYIKQRSLLFKSFCNQVYKKNYIIANVILYIMNTLKKHRK